MRRLAVPALIAALAVAVLAVTSAAAPLPNLRTATAKRGHVIVIFSLGELVPGRILVAVSPKTAASGKFVAANVRLSEPLRSVKTSTGYRARTRHTLPTGRYYVQVSGTALLTDCTKLKPCPTRWSNARRVRIH